MITVNALKVKGVSQDNYLYSTWQSALANAVRDPYELLRLLDLTDDKYRKKLYLSDNFKLLVPHSYVAKMKKRDWNDPLLKQVLPIQDETKSVVGFVADPVGDLNAVISSGVLQKYQGRVLLITTGACAVHCRYCFRRHFPYASSMPDKNKWQETLLSIQKDKSIHEVILSGGDPLMIPDDRLQTMCEDIAQIPHVKTLRFHTRIPIFLPERINSTFLEWATALPIQKVMVIHANHANELDKVVGETLAKLHEAGFTLLNQSVLLKGVNDRVETLRVLSHQLFSLKVLPYYLHQLDKVEGGAHFEVDRKQAIKLLKDLKKCLPGYLTPRLVEEISGERSKLAIE